MIDDCLMTEDCPGYDHDRRMCLIRPGDCDFRPADGDTGLMLEPAVALPPDASAEAVSR